MVLTKGKLIVVSNRLPVTVLREGDRLEVRASSGGLVTALRPVVQSSDGYWVGGAGTEQKPEVESLLKKSGRDNGFHLIPVFLDEEERINFYRGFCNEIIWPLFHDLQSRCNFDPTYWKAYLSVNQRFAREVARVASKGSLIWVHDYQLMLAGLFLRKLGVRSKLGFFHHIPFPPPDIYEKLPWREEILRALLEFDVVGLQTPRDLRNFGNCVRRLLPEVKLHRRAGNLVAHIQRRRIFIGSFPIGIDFDEFHHEAGLPRVTESVERLHEDLPSRQIVLGVDRLDYTKGIPERLRAFQYLLSSHPELRGRITLIQVVVPSRQSISGYKELKQDIERLVSQINGKYGGPDWVPVHYIHRHLTRHRLLVFYRAADVALVTPLKDGMNLVAKEYCAAQVHKKGVLVLSEFAGAAAQLRGGAILVNPYHLEKVAAAIYEALIMDPHDRKAAMGRLRRRIRAANVFRWCEAFCTRLATSDGSTKPALD